MLKNSPVSPLTNTMIAEYWNNSKPITAIDIFGKTPLEDAYDQLVAIWSVGVAGTFAGLVVMAIAGIVRL